MLKIAIAIVPTLTSTTIGGIWAIFHLRYTQNIQASFEILFYFFAGGLIAGIVGITIGIISNFFYGFTSE